MNYSLRLIKLKQVLRYAHQQDSRKYKSCLEDSTIRNPVHTRETRMCGGYSANPHYCLEGSTQSIRYSLPGWLVDGRSISEGILSFVEYAPRLRIVLPSRQIRITRLAEILKSKLKILIKSLLKKRDKNTFLVSPSYGLCLWQIPCWCEFSFSLVSLWGLPEKMSLTQQEPLRKDKI